MKLSHLCKQHHLECVYNTPETVNNSMQLYNYVVVFEVFCTDKLFINEREHDLVASKFLLKNTDTRRLTCNYNSRIRINLLHLSYSELMIAGTSEHVFIKHQGVSLEIL